MSSLSDPTDAVSPENIPPAPDLPTSGDGLNELLSNGARVAFRGSVFIDGQHYPHGEKLADLCEELDLEYKQSVTKSTCDLLVSDDLDAQDTKAELARKYDKPVITSEDFADWAQERLEGAEEVGDQASAVEDVDELIAKQTELAMTGADGIPREMETQGGQASWSLPKPLLIFSLVSIFLTVVVLARRRSAA